MEPAALIISNVEEISHWVIAQLNDGRYKNKQAIPSVAIKETIRASNFDGGFLNFDEIFAGGYGLGRVIASYKGHYFLYHEGSAGGYRSTISFLPKDSIGIIVLTNTVQGAFFADAIALGICDLLLNKEKTPWSKRFALRQDKMAEDRENELSSARSLRVQNSVPSHALADYAGIYENKIYGEIQIAIINDQLYFHFRYTDQPLEHFQYDQFWTKEQANYSVYPQLFPLFKLQFFTNEKGKIDKFRTRIINDPETEFIKIVKN